MRIFKLVALAMSGVILCCAVADAQNSGWGSRIKNLSWFKKDAPSSSSRTPHTAPTSSQTTFAPSPLAPQPSVTMPAPTSPAGSTPRVARNTTPFGSRIWSAATSAGEAMRIKPREVAAPDPVRLDNKPTVGMESGVFVSAARVYEMQGKYPQAREHYEKALAAQPDHLDALVGLARLKHREGDLVAATDMYQRALRKHPNNALVLNDLGLCYARRDMLQQAEQSIGRAVKIDPDSKLYRNNMALVLVEMGQRDAALQQLMSVHSQAISHYNLAYLLKAKGMNDEAAKELNVALQVDPSLQPARAMLAQLNPAPQFQQPQYQQPQYQPPQRQPLPDGRGRLGAPQLTNQPQYPQRSPAPVVTRPPSRSEYPVSHRHGFDSTPPAAVGEVDMRFNGGSAADYRRGPGGNSDASTGSNPSTSSPWSQGTNYGSPQSYNPDGYRNPALNGSTSGGASRNLAAPSPGQMPDYMRGDGSSTNPAPAYSAPANGGSRWTTQ